MSKNTIGYCAFTATILCALFAASVQAGILDPRLAALTTRRPSIARTPTGPRTQPLDAFSPRLDASGRVQVYVLPVSRFAALPGTGEIAALGGVKIVVSKPLRTVQAWVPVSTLTALAALPDVGRVKVPAYAVIPRPIGVVKNETPQHQSGALAIPRAVPTGLAIDAAAVQAMQANLLQNVNAQGASIKVGVISDDNSGMAESQAAGYLPATIWADPTYPGTTATPGDPAEGTAMLEEVHAMAPNASLGFCGPSTTVDFLTCYNDFVAWGANVVADDLGYASVDAFTIGATADGSFAAAIAQITLANPKVAFTSSAGNDAQDYFQAPYTAGPACTINGTAYPSCMDFGKALGQSSANAIAVTFNSTTMNQPIFVMEWNDPLSNNTADKLTLYLVNKTGTVLATGGYFTAADDARTEEVIQQYTPAAAGETDYLEVACVSCGNHITIKLIGNGDGAVQFGTPTPGSVDAGQKVASGVLATVAAGVTSQNPLSANIEAFSGIGPFLYGDYTGTSTLAKPDITGIDGVTVSGAGGFGSSRPLPNGGVEFCGTSATSPNVGALIADMMSADPGQPASVYYTALENSASQTAITNVAFNGCGALTSTGYTSTASGAGLAQGFSALQSFFTFPSTSITAPISVASGASGSYTVPTGLGIGFTASVKAGTNSATAANCAWVAGVSLPNGTTQTGASVAYNFTAAGNYAVEVNCPDSQGILNPTPPTIEVTAESIPAPTVAISGTSSSSFTLTLTGHEPLTVRATSSNTAIYPVSGIQFSSGCGTSTLNCTVSLSPVGQTSGSSTITVTATDQYGQTGNGAANVSYTYTPPSSGGGGGGIAWLALAFLSLGLAMRTTWRTRHSRPRFED